jgi:8-oxo-dGTP pyrophosphatase MutT (NUDIX family)
MRFVLPEAAADRAAAVAAGREQPVPVRPAATLVLLRDSPRGVEAYLQQRHTTLQFAGGMHAFPGGRVDEADGRVPQECWAPPGPHLWAQQFGVDAAQAAAHAAGAVREVFEETGVLLARPGPGTGTWPGEPERAALAAGSVCLGDRLVRYGLQVHPRDLVGWSRWLTPRFERRRFDAWFFVAALPEGQQPRVATGESHEGRWLPAAEAVELAAARRLAMLPPTWWTLREVAVAVDVQDALAHPPAMRRYTAGWARQHGDAVLVLPDDPAYPGEDPAEGT